MRTGWTRLVFNQVWEDFDVDKEAMDYGPGDVVVCVASGGCSALGVALHPGVEVHATDLNPAQIALLELKRTAALNLDTEQFQAFFRNGRGLDLPHVSVRLMIDPASLEPTSRQDCPRAKLSVERDPYEYRGSGGVLYDVSHDYDGDDWLLVASGGQVLFQPLADLAERMADRGGDVCVVAHEDGTPSGLMLIRAACLSVIPAIGFVDMKEQALPRIAEDYQVNVMRLDQISGMPIRTLDGYIAALRQRHLQLSGDTSWENAFAERRPVFQIVQDGTSVSDDAELQDSVVLEGGRVAAGAVVVRSIVSGRGNVPAGRMVVDQIVASSAGPRPRPGQGGPS